MRIDLKNGGWLEGEAVLTTIPCGCPTCTCEPFWDVRIYYFDSNGKNGFSSFHGAKENTEQAATEELTNGMKRWQEFFDSK